jgi:hypothetical protein
MAHHGVQETSGDDDASTQFPSWGGALMLGGGQTTPRGREEGGDTSEGCWLAWKRREQGEGGGGF